MVFGAIVKAVGSGIQRFTGGNGGGGGGGGGAGNRGGGLRTTSNPGAAIARQQIIDYSGEDVLGNAAEMQLTVDGVARLEDINRYVAEQKELLKYASKKIEQITDNAAEMERMISEIIMHQLKTRAEVDKYIKNVHVAGDKYSAHTAKLNQEYTNEQRVIAGETAGEMSLDNVETKLKMLMFKHRVDTRKKNAELSHKEQIRTADRQEAESVVRKKEAEARRYRITKGDGNTPTNVGFTRFKSQI